MFRKIWFILFIVVVALSCFLPVNVCAETSPPDITAESAVVMDAETGQVVYSKNMTEKAYPASITKIMTALLAVEKGNMSDILTATESAVGNEAVNRCHSRAFCMRQCCLLRMMQPMSLLNISVDLFLGLPI